MRKFYLIWRIWAVTRNLQRTESTEGEEVLDTYYAELYEREWPPKEEGNDGNKA